MKGQGLSSQMVLSFFACVYMCVHRQGAHFYKHLPKSNASSNPQLLEKVMKKVIGNIIEITFFCTKVMLTLNWNTWFPGALHQRSAFWNNCLDKTSQRNNLKYP